MRRTTASSRAGHAGKCELCKKEKKRGTEMVKCRVCAGRMCATCHNLKTRQKSTPDRKRSTLAEPGAPERSGQEEHAEYDQLRPAQNEKTSASLMWKGDDTQEHEMLNLLVWAIPVLILSEDEAVTELHKEHHSRAAGLKQRLAAAELDEWDGLIARNNRKKRKRATRTPTISKPRNKLTTGTRTEQISKRTVVA